MRMTQQYSFSEAPLRASSQAWQPKVLNIGMLLLDSHRHIMMNAKKF